MALLYRILYRLYRVSSGLRHWGQQRFTPAGLALLCGLVIAAIMGPDTENNVAYQAFTLLLCLLLVAGTFTFLFRASFSATRILPRFGSVGAPLGYLVRLQNLTNKNQIGLMLFEDLADPRPSFKEWRAAQTAAQRQARSFRLSRRPSVKRFRVAKLQPGPVPNALPQQQVDVRLELTPLRRGLLQFHGMKLARPDPLGLVRAFAKLPLPQSALILPKRYPLPALSFPGTLKFQDGGVALASNVGQSDEFVSLRDYRYGDPLRHIHWRTWAKAGKPVVKEFEDEFFVRHALVLDTFTEEPQSDLFEEAVSVAASFACAIQTQESLLDLLFVGPQSFCFTAGRGLAHTDQMLEILASVQPCSDKPFTALEDLVLNHVKAVSGCVCVLLAWDDARQKFIEKLRALGVPVRVLVLAAPGTASSLEPGPMQDSPESFKALELGQVPQGLATLS